MGTPEPLKPVPAATQDLRRKTVRVKDGVAICPLPREHVVVGCESSNGSLFVDYLAALDAPVEVERPFRVARSRPAAKLARVGGAGFTMPDVQSVFELGGGSYAFALAAREIPAQVSVAPVELPDAPEDAKL